jgi:peptidylprolyl isomerase
LGNWLATSTRSIGSVALIGVVGVALAGCGGGKISTEPAKSKSTMSAAESAQLSRPRIQPPSGAPPKRLIVEDLKKGWGFTAKRADEITIDYAGTDYGAAAERWSSRDGLGPFRFQLGGRGVISGWEQGLEGMRVGGRRKLIVPSRLATRKGARIYVIDLLAVRHQDSSPIAVGASDGIQDPGKPSAAVPNRPPPKVLVVEELRRGSGPRVETPSEVTVKYLGVDYETGLAFFNAWGPDRASRLSLGNLGRVWAVGLKGMRIGGRRRLIVPAKLGYGSGPLIYAVELLAID